MSDLFASFQTYCRVVERGSVSRAALDLDLAQATASRHLRELEARYGAVLITRTTRHLQITPAGQQVYDYVSSLLRSEGELAERLAVAGSGLGGRVTVAGPSGFGHAVLHPFLIEHSACHPELQIRVLLSERHVNLVEEAVDVAIRIGQLVDSSLQVKSLGTLREVLVASPRLFRAGQPPASPEDVLQMPRVGLISGVSGQAGHPALHAVLDVPPVLEVDSSLALRDALLAGRGYGAIHEYLVTEALADGRLVPLLPQWPLPQWPLNALFVARNRPRRVDHLVSALADHLRARRVGTAPRASGRLPHAEQP
jgi:DNA-binding transcriptional LysR family regulator